MGPREVVEGLQAGPRPGRGRGGRSGRNSRPITIHEAGGTTEALLRDLLLTRPQLQQQLQQAVLARAQSVPSIMLAAAAHSPRAQLPTRHPQPPHSPDSSMGDDSMSSFAAENLEVKYRKGRKSKKNELARLLSKGLSESGSIGAESISQEMNKSTAHIPESTSELLSNGHLAAQYAVLERQALARSRSCSMVHSTVMSVDDQNEPLNLCVRDTPLPPEDCCTPVPITPIVKIEPPSQCDEDAASSVGNNTHLTYEDESHGSRSSRTPFTPPADYPSWNVGSSLAPYWLNDYRLKTEDGLSSGHSTPSLCSQSSHLPSTSPPAWPHLSSPPPLTSPHSPSPAPMGSPMGPSHHHPRHLQALLKDSFHHQFDEARERLTPRQSIIGFAERSANLSSRPGSTRGSPHKGGTRRKRSAIFIPPSDPNTEVSICKFKFTGGANPMLEEKKMVSVDSGGNLRYFSGGDKGVPRDNRLAAAQLTLSGKILENLSKCEKDVKKIRLESDNDDTCSLPGGQRSCHSATTSPVCTLDRSASLYDPAGHPPTPTEESPKRKRRSKKSSVREKLEQTLRERGLLIQTQQVESAEGATYCKFRQLRKITRYLFRSWKDYLPGQLHEGAPGDPNLHIPGKDGNFPHPHYDMAGNDFPTEHR